MNIVLAIDPGPQKSGIVIWNGIRVLYHGIFDNETFIAEELPLLNADILIIEQIRSYGMAVSDSVFDTVFWTGRFVQAWKGPWLRIPRREVKLHICGTIRAKDTNIRQALIDKFGQPGTKKFPGPLYGIKKDEWAALALAVYYLTQTGRGDGVPILPAY